MKNLGGNFKLSTVVIEAVSIVLAVLLALGVDEWREGRSQQQQADSALVNITKELEANQKILKLIHKNNVETIKVMAEEQEEGEDSVDDDQRNFIPGTQLRDTAWETLLSTGISNYVDYDTLLELSETYSIQRVYKDTGSQMTLSAMNVAAYATALGTEPDNAHFQRQFTSVFETIVQVEAALLERYQASVSMLDSADP